MTSLKKSTLAALLSAAFLGAACTSSNPDLIRRSDTQRLSQIQDAVVINVRSVTVEGTQSGAGAATGSVLGGLAGSSVGGRRENIAAGVIGAVAGAVIGHTIERMSTQEKAVEIVVELPNGERRAIVQAQGQEVFNTGEPVVLVTTGGKTRVSKAGAVPASPY